MEASSLVFGVGNAVWTTAAKKPSRWPQQALEAAERGMFRQHEYITILSREPHASDVGRVQSISRRGQQLDGNRG